MLYEVAAETDVQHLRAAADSEYGHFARKRALEQRELCAVAVRADAEGLRVRLGAVQLRIEVGAAGEEQPVDGVERLLEAARAEDGTIEAIEDPGRRFAVGVLWHPEAGEDMALFQALVDEARAYRGERR